MQRWRIIAKDIVSFQFVNAYYLLVSFKFLNSNFPEGTKEEVLMLQTAPVVTYLLAVEFCVDQ